jgi:hypothetical protein
MYRKEEYIIIFSPKNGDKHFSTKVKKNIKNILNGNKEEY